MKKLFIGLLVLGLTNLSFSQNMNYEFPEIEFEEIYISPLNISYLAKVQDHTTPSSVLSLENKASRYNIKTSGVYNTNYDTYRVTFTQPNGKIIAHYDKNGKIINSFEKFKNVGIPFHVRVEVFKKHPGWAVHSDTYLVSYNSGNDAKKVYKIQLRKGKLKKNLKVDGHGNIM